MQVLPAFLADTNYQNPEGQPHTPARHAFGCEFYEYLSKHPEKSAAFDSAMQMSDIVPPEALPKYPFAKEAAELFSDHSDRVALVDVGGGRGQYLARLMKENPGLPGRYILQDLQHSIDPLKGTCHPFEAMAHDMFRPQPIKGKL